MILLPPPTPVIAMAPRNDSQTLTMAASARRAWIIARLTRVQLLISGDLEALDPDQRRTPGLAEMNEGLAFRFQQGAESRAEMRGVTVTDNAVVTDRPGSNC